MKNITSERYIYNYVNTRRSSTEYWKIAKGGYETRYLNKKLYSFDDAIKIRDNLYYSN